MEQQNPLTACHHRLLLSTLCILSSLRTPLLSLSTLVRAEVSVLENQDLNPPNVKLVTWIGRSLKQPTNEFEENKVARLCTPWISTSIWKLVPWMSLLRLLSRTLLPCDLPVNPHLRIRPWRQNRVSTIDWTCPICKVNMTLTGHDKAYGARKRHLQIAHGKDVNEVGPPTRENLFGP